jgi:hypothetical protein
VAVAVDDHDTVAEDVGGNAGRMPPKGGCYEPGFTIVKPGLGLLDSGRNAMQRGKHG